MGTLSSSLPTFQGPSPSSFPAGWGSHRSVQLELVLLGGVVRGTAQISALSLKRARFIRIGIYIGLLPLGQDNEVLLDTKHQIYTRYSAIRDINVIPNPQLAVGVGSENICCCLDRSNAIMSCMLLPSAGFCRTQMREEYTSGSTGSDCYCCPSLKTK